MTGFACGLFDHVEQLQQGYGCPVGHIDRALLEMRAGFEGRRQPTVRAGEILRVAADRACREFAPSRDDLPDAKLGIEIDRLALGDQEWILRKWGRMEIEEVVTVLKKRLQLLGADVFVAGPVQPVAIFLLKQAVHVENDVTSLSCQGLLICPNQSQSAALQDACSAEEVEEELLDCVNATDLIAMDPAEEHDPRPVHIGGDPHDALD